MDLALNNEQRLICHKPKQTKQVQNTKEVWSTRPLKTIADKALFKSSKLKIQRGFGAQGHRKL